MPALSSKVVYPKESISNVPNSYNDLKVSFKEQMSQKEKTYERKDGSKFTKKFPGDFLFVCFIATLLPESFADDFNSWFSDNNKKRGMNGRVRVSALDDSEVNIDETVPAQREGMKYFRITVPKQIKNKQTDDLIETNSGFINFLRSGIKICILKHKHIVFPNSNSTDEDKSFGEGKGRTQRESQESKNNSQESRNNSHKKKQHNFQQRQQHFRTKPVGFLEKSFKSRKPNFNELVSDDIIQIINDNPKATELVVEFSDGSVKPMSLDLSFDPYRYVSTSQYGKPFELDEDGNDSMKLDFISRVSDFVSKVNGVISARRYYNIIIPFDKKGQDILNETDELRNFIDDKWDTDSESLNDDDWINFICTIGFYGTARLGMNFNMSIISHFIKKTVEFYGAPSEDNSLSNTYAGFLQFVDNYEETTTQKTSSELREERIKINNEYKRLIRNTYYILTSLDERISDDELSGIMEKICGADVKISSKDLTSDVKLNISSNYFVYELKNTSGKTDSETNKMRKSLAKNFLKKFDGELKSYKTTDATIGCRITLQTELKKYGLLPVGAQFYC